MSIETETDRLEVLKALGEIVDVSGRQVWGIFERTSLEISFDSAVDAMKPSLLVRSSDVESIGRGASVIRKGNNYSVATINPDGEGMTTLELNEA